jgi:hypothetical protein
LQNGDRNPGTSGLAFEEKNPRQHGDRPAIQKLSTRLIANEFYRKFSQNKDRVSSCQTAGAKGQVIFMTRG